MTDTTSARHRLPFLVTAQAQKELTHNEALLRIDALMHPVIESAQATPAAGLGLADAGKCWLIDDNAQNEWTAHGREIACWTGGSWRFLNPADGMRVWDRSQNHFSRYIGGAWTAAIAVADPAGGTNVDTEARATLNQLLQHFRQAGLLAS